MTALPRDSLEQIRPMTRTITFFILGIGLHCSAAPGRRRRSSRCWSGKRTSRLSRRRLGEGQPGIAGSRSGEAQSGSGVPRPRAEANMAGPGPLFIVRNGYVIWAGPECDRQYQIFSATKSFTSTVLGLLDRRRQGHARHAGQGPRAGAGRAVSRPSRCVTSPP